MSCSPALMKIFLPAQPVTAIGLRLGLGAQQPQVGAAMGLGQAHGAGPLAARHLGQIGLLLGLCAVGVQALIGAVGQAGVHGPGLVGAVEHFVKTLVHHDGQALAAISRITTQRRPAPGHKGLVGGFEAFGRFDVMGLTVELAALRIPHGVQRRQDVGGEFPALFQHGGQSVCIQF